MVRNLAIITFILVCVLCGMYVYDYLQMPSKGLTIFYTSNLRGQINPFSGSVEGRQYNQLGGLAFIKGFIKKMAKPYNYDPKNVILLDTGDALFGTAEATLTMGDMPLKLMNKCGYDAMAIGNFEFEFGFDKLKSFIQSNQVPMLACNYRDVSSPVGNIFKPGIIVEKEGAKIGIIGLGQDDIFRNTRKENIMSLEVSDMQSSVQKTAAYLKENGAEIIILLSHHPISTIKNPSKVFPDVDIIIGDLIGPSAVVFGQKPLICQTASNRGAGIGFIKIIQQSGKWQIEEAFHRIIPIESNNIEPDQELLQDINKFESKIDNLLDEVITNSNGKFTNSFMEESSMGYLIADSMKEASGADVALTNSGGIKSVLYPGQVTLRNLYEILPFENSLITVEIPGYELESLIELSLTDGKSGFLQSSGIECLYSPANPGGCKIIQIDINGNPLELEATYTVAINDFMYSNTVDWPELSAGKNPLVIDVIRESFKKYLKNRNSIAPLEKPNYKTTNEDVLVRLPITSELVNLTNPVTQDSSSNYQYASLVCEMIRRETGSDFALLPSSIINKSREPLVSVTMARMLSDFTTSEGVSIVEMTGEMIRKIMSESLKAQNNISFAGFSIEKSENSFNIIPWSDRFEDELIYKVAINEHFVKFLDNATQTDLKITKRFSDIRKTFIEGLRKAKGKVELKRAFY